MGQISTVEQFFQYFVYMKKPSEMPREIDLFFFPLFSLLSQKLK
jgi:hypothetical protein